MSFIGPIESLAPSPGPGRARVIGGAQMLRFAGNVGGPLAQAGVQGLQRWRAGRAGKDFNDEPTQDPVGSDSGKLLTAGGDAAEAAAAL